MLISLSLPRLPLHDHNVHGGGSITLNGDILRNNKDLPETWRRMAALHVDELYKLGFSKSTLIKARMVLREVPFIVKVKSPKTMRRKQYINYVHYLIEKFDHSDYRKQKLSTLNRFLARFENFVFSSVKYNWAPSIPQNVSWLSDMEMGQILVTPMEPVEGIMFWMESRMGCRRIEVIRSNINDFDLEKSRFYVRGKGGKGGKGRRLMIPPSGHREIPKYLKFREEAITRQLDQDPEAKIPDNFIIYLTKQHPPRLTNLKETMADTFMERLSERSGVRFTNHDLRRTYGRKLYDADVKLPALAKVLGHSSTKHTERYLGLNDDDVADAMLKGDM